MKKISYKIRISLVLLRGKKVAKWKKMRVLSCRRRWAVSGYTTLPNYGLLQALKFTSAIKTKATQPIIYLSHKGLELNVVVVVENKTNKRQD